MNTREQFSWPNISPHIQNKWVIIFRLHSTAIWLMFSGGAPDGFRGPDVCLPCCNHPCSDTGVVSFHRSLNYPNYLSDCWYTIMLFKPGTVVFPSVFVHMQYFPLTVYDVLLRSPGCVHFNNPDSVQPVTSLSEDQSFYTFYDNYPLIVLQWRCVLKSCFFLLHCTVKQ